MQVLSRRTLEKKAVVFANFTAARHLASVNRCNTDVSVKSNTDQRLRSIARRSLLLTSLTVFPALAETDAEALYRDEQGRFEVKVPKNWLKKNKPGAEAYFYDSKNARTNIGITINPVRAATTQSFGTLEAVGDRLFNAERQKDGFLGLELLEERAESTSSGSQYNIYAYILDTTRGRKAIITGR